MGGSLSSTQKQPNPNYFQDELLCPIYGAKAHTQWLFEHFATSNTSPILRPIFTTFAFTKTSVQMASELSNEELLEIFEPNDQNQTEDFDAMTATQSIKPLIVERVGTGFEDFLMMTCPPVQTTNPLTGNDIYKFPAQMATGSQYNAILNEIFPLNVDRSWEGYEGPSIHDSNNPNHSTSRNSSSFNNNNSAHKFEPPKHNNNNQNNVIEYGKKDNMSFSKLVRFYPVRSVNLPLYPKRKRLVEPFGFIILIVDFTDNESIEAIGDFLRDVIALRLQGCMIDLINIPIFVFYFNSDKLDGFTHDVHGDVDRNSCDYREGELFLQSTAQPVSSTTPSIQCPHPDLVNNAYLLNLSIAQLVSIYASIENDFEFNCAYSPSATVNMVPFAGTPLNLDDPISTNSLSFQPQSSSHSRQNLPSPSRLQIHKSNLSADSTKTDLTPPLLTATLHVMGWNPDKIISTHLPSSPSDLNGGPNAIKIYYEIMNLIRSYIAQILPHTNPLLHKPTMIRPTPYHSILTQIPRVRYRLPPQPYVYLPFPPGTHGKSRHPLRLAHSSPQLRIGTVMISIEHRCLNMIDYNPAEPTEDDLIEGNVGLMLQLENAFGELRSIDPTPFNGRITDEPNFTPIQTSFLSINNEFNPYQTEEQIRQKRLYAQEQQNELLYNQHSLQGDSGTTTPPFHNLKGFNTSTNTFAIEPFEQFQDPMHIPSSFSNSTNIPPLINIKPTTPISIPIIPTPLTLAQTTPPILHPNCRPYISLIHPQPHRQPRRLSSESSYTPPMLTTPSPSHWDSHASSFNYQLNFFRWMTTRSDNNGGLPMTPMNTPDVAFAINIIPFPCYSDDLIEHHRKMAKYSRKPTKAQKMTKLATHASNLDPLTRPNGRYDTTSDGDNASNSNYNDNNPRRGSFNRKNGNFSPSSSLYSPSSGKFGQFNAPYSPTGSSNNSFGSFNRKSKTYNGNNIFNNAGSNSNNTNGNTNDQSSNGYQNHISPDNSSNNSDHLNVIISGSNYPYNNFNPTPSSINSNGDNNNNDNGLNNTNNYHTNPGSPENSNSDSEFFQPTTLQDLTHTYSDLGALVPYPPFTCDSNRYNSHTNTNTNNNNNNNNSIRLSDNESYNSYNSRDTYNTNSTNGTNGTYGNTSTSTGSNGNNNYKNQNNNTPQRPSHLSKHYNNNQIEFNKHQFSPFSEQYIENLINTALKTDLPTFLKPSQRSMFLDPIEENNYYNSENELKLLNQATYLSESHNDSLSKSSSLLVDSIYQNNNINNNHHNNINNIHTLPNNNSTSSNTLISSTASVSIPTTAKGTPKSTSRSISSNPASNNRPTTPSTNNSNNKSTQHKTPQKSRPQTPQKQPTKSPPNALNWHFTDEFLVEYPVYNIIVLFYPKTQRNNINSVNHSSLDPPSRLSVNTSTNTTTTTTSCSSTLPRDAIDPHDGPAHKGILTKSFDTLVKEKFAFEAYKHHWAEQEIAIRMRHQKEQLLGSKGSKFLYKHENPQTAIRKMHREAIEGDSHSDDEALTIAESKIQHFNSYQAFFAVTPDELIFLREWIQEDAMRRRVSMMWTRGMNPE